MVDASAGAWDREYERNRYVDEPPVAMVERIVEVARSLNISDGLYIGCGNGRNLIPLLDEGFNLLGVDSSPKAIERLRQRLGRRQVQTPLCGTVDDLDVDRRFSMVLGLQVFQHGTQAEAHRNVCAALRRVAVGGIFCLRVNAVGTEVWPAHRVVEAEGESFTVLYEAGPKAGLNIHFFSRDEIAAIIPSSFAPIETVRKTSEPRTPPAPGVWCQWEGMWVRNR